MSNPCAPRPHRAYRGILGHVRHHAARSVDCNPHAAGGVARALKGGLVAAGIGAGAIGAGVGGAAAADAWWPASWQPGSTGDAWHGEPIGGGADGSSAPCPPAQDVPEPAGLLVLAVGVAGMVVCRRVRW